MKKILLVEDEEYIADMYKMKFEKHGYETIVAADGEEGLKLAESRKPDLILLDLVLPRLSGFEVLKKLKENKKTKDIKVYIISNLGQNGEINHGFKDGADGYLIKSSLTPSQLVENVGKIFEGKAVGIKRIVSSVAEVKKENARIKKKSARALLFEDNEVISEMYKLGLEKAGFEVEVAGNGAWGFKLANEKKFDIILMDMIMPALNGYEAIKKLKASEKTRGVPVIILSNSAQDYEIEGAKKLGAAGYLLKSQITPVKLAREIKKILSIS